MVQWLIVVNVLALGPRDPEFAYGPCLIYSTG